MYKVNFDSMAALSFRIIDILCTSSQDDQTVLMGKAIGISFADQKCPEPP